MTPQESLMMRMQIGGPKPRRLFLRVYLNNYFFAKENMPTVLQMKAICYSGSGWTEEDKRVTDLILNEINEAYGPEIAKLLPAGIE